MSEKKRALVIFGSPRYKKSASYHLGQHFANGLKRAGMEVEEIMLVKQKINHCIGCFTCWTKTPGKCVHRDDMDILLPKIRNTDLIVYAIPLYIFSVPGIVKDFLDRQLPLVEPYLVKKDGITSHPIRNKSKKKDVFVISVAGFPERSHFDAMVDMFKKKTRPADETYIGDILIGGAERMSKDDSQDGYKALYNYIEQAGFEVATNSAVSKETQKLINEESMMKSEDIDTFIDIANKYWDSLMPKDYSQVEIKKSADAKPLKITDGGMAAFFAGMSRIYNPNGIPGLKAVLQFNLDKDQYHLIIDEDGSSAYKGPHPNPTTTIISTADTWMKISTGELDGAQGLMKGLYKVEGDMSLLMNMDKMFSEKEISETGSEDISVETQKITKKIKNFNNIPDHRGPLKIKGSSWLTIAFIPWIVLWVLNSIPILSGLIPRIIGMCIALFLLMYHLLTNRPTLFEFGTSIYLIFSMVLYGLGLEFFIIYSSALDYIFLGGLWLGSLLKQFTLTAEYSRLEYPKVIWGEFAFTETNKILSGIWGLYFLLAAVLNLIMISDISLKLILIIITYILLVPMFIFTSWFQKWYPEKLFEN